MKGDDLAVGMREDIAVKIHRDCSGDGISQALGTLDSAIQPQRSVMTDIVGNALHAMGDIAEHVGSTEPISTSSVLPPISARKQRPYSTCTFSVYSTLCYLSRKFTSVCCELCQPSSSATKRTFCRQPLRVIQIQRDGCQQHVSWRGACLGDALLREMLADK